MKDDAQKLLKERKNQIIDNILKEISGYSSCYLLQKDILLEAANKLERDFSTTKSWLRQDW